MWTRLQAFSRLKGTERLLWKDWSDSAGTETLFCAEWEWGARPPRAR